VEARIHAPALVVTVTDNINEALVALEQRSGPLLPFEFPTSLTTKLCENFDELSIYH